MKKLKKQIEKWWQNSWLNDKYEWLQEFPRGGKKVIINAKGIIPVDGKPAITVKGRRTNLIVIGDVYASEAHFLKHLKVKSEVKKNTTKYKITGEVKHLQFCLDTAAMTCNELRHPQEVMKELGITYQYATPVSVASAWWFWNCENIPENLPEFLTNFDVDPMKYVGYGLSEERAKEIRDYENL